MKIAITEGVELLSDFTRFNLMAGVGFLAVLVIFGCLGPLVVLVAWPYCAVWSALAAADKGYSAFLWGFFGLFLGIFAVAIAVLLPERERETFNRNRLI